MTTMEQILESAIKQQGEVMAQSVEETRRISDRQYRLLGDPTATVADLHDDTPEAPADVPSEA